jgi:hypothetical protein
MTVLRTLTTLLLAFTALAAHGEIYKCGSKKSMTVYQNFPCETDSLGSMPTRSSNPEARTTSLRPQAAPAPVSGNPATAIAESRNASSVPRMGMTTDDVKTIWGEPRETTKEEFAKGDIEIWTYADSRSIHFDRKGRVTAIHW